MTNDTEEGLGPAIVHSLYMRIIYVNIETSSTRLGQGFELPIHFA